MKLENGTDYLEDDLLPEARDFFADVDMLIADLTPIPPNETETTRKEPPPKKFRVLVVAGLHARE